MKKYIDVRPHAVSAWVNSDGSINNATSIFTDTCKRLGLDIPDDPRSFIAYWRHQQQQHNSVKGHASNSGRNSLLSKAQAKRCLDIALNWRKDGRSGPYRCVQDLINKAPAVRKIMESSGASPRTLTRAMKSLCPTFGYKKLTVKAKLTTKHREARVAVCQKNLQVSDDTLQTVVWIDAKTMYMNITDRYGWVDTAEDDIFETHRPASRKSNIIKLKYYIAVNARLGAVKLVFYTGTTGMPAERDGKTYLVSSATV